MNIDDEIQKDIHNAGLHLCAHKRRYTRTSNEEFWSDGRLFRRVKYETICTECDTVVATKFDRWRCVS